jgi:hypothetical protein
LFLGGGPGKNESYRNIELKATVYTKLISTNFLVNGDQSENVGLKDNDVIRIPAYSQSNNRRPGETSGNFRDETGSRFLIYYHLPQGLLSLPIQPQ